MTNAEIYQAQLEQAQKRKRELLRHIKDLRTIINDLKPGHKRDGSERESLEARERYAKFLAMEREAVFLVPGWEYSKGTRAEIRRSQELGIPVFDDLRILREWASK